MDLEHGIPLDRIEGSASMTTGGLLRIKLTLDFHVPVPKPSDTSASQENPTTPIAKKVKKQHQKKKKKKTRAMNTVLINAGPVQSNGIGEDSDGWMLVNASEGGEEDIMS